MTDSTGIDTLALGAGIKAGQVQLARSPYNDGTLNLVINQATGDVISLRNFFDYDGNVLEHLDRITFATGVIWSTQTVLTKLLAGTDADQNLRGYGSNDTLRAGRQRHPRWRRRR